MMYSSSTKVCKAIAVKICKTVFCNILVDPRVQHLPLVGSPLPMAVIIISYLAFVLYYGPKWMENRKPFNLKYVMRVYNAIQVLANSFIFIYVSIFASCMCACVCVCVYFINIILVAFLKWNF